MKSSVIKIFMVCDVLSFYHSVSIIPLPLII
nr:MAG TPA: hypothetical protein [Caudoviricetes sp.]